MRNHEEQMERRLQQVLEQIRPDEAAKDRMYLEIMRRAASQKTVKKRPWYLRWQTSAGICTAALACVVIAVASFHGRMPQNGTEQLQVVTPKTTTEAVSEKEPALTQSEYESASRLKTVTTAVFVMETVQTQIISSGTGNEGTEPSVEELEELQPAVTGQESEQQHRQTVAVTAPAKANVPTVQTTVKPSETTVPVQTPSTDEAETTAPADNNISGGSTDVPIRQNIYLYYKLTWGGVHYDTQYAEASGKGLEYLGYGVTSGADTDGTYTVLIYAMEGIDSTQQLAVQYAGEDTYYIFTNAQ